MLYSLTERHLFFHDLSETDARELRFYPILSDFCSCADRCMHYLRHVFFAYNQVDPFSEEWLVRATAGWAPVLGGIRRGCRPRAEPRPLIGPRCTTNTPQQHDHQLRAGTVHTLAPPPLLLPPPIASAMAAQPDMYRLVERDGILHVDAAAPSGFALERRQGGAGASVSGGGAAASAADSAAGAGAAASSRQVAAAATTTTTSPAAAATTTSAAAA